MLPNVQFIYIFADNSSNLWKEQKELLSEMGLSVGDDPRNPDTLDQLEKLDDLEDEMGEAYLEGNYQLKNVTRRWRSLFLS